MDISGFSEDISGFSEDISGFSEDKTYFFTVPYFVLRKNEVFLISF